MFLHFDFETTGIPVSGMPSDHPDHPHPVSLSAFKDEAPDAILGEMNTLIKPDGFRIEDFPGAFKVHGITTERAMAEGIPLANAMEQYIELARASTLVAYNAHFDVKLLKIACARLGAIGEAMRIEIEKLQSICTMESAAMHLTGKRRMKLKDAYFELFKEETQTEKHHGSSKDALASRRIFWELKKRGAIPEAKSLERKVYDTPPPAVPGTHEEAVAPVRKRPGGIG